MEGGRAGEREGGGEREERKASTSTGRIVPMREGGRQAGREGGREGEREREIKKGFYLNRSHSTNELLSFVSSELFEQKKMVP
jgi:hypothetical protein